VIQLSEQEQKLISAVRNLYFNSGEQLATNGAIRREGGREGGLHQVTSGGHFPDELSMSLYIFQY